MTSDGVPSELPPRRSLSDSVMVPHRLAMGLSVVPEGESWLEPDSDLGADLALKRELFAERRDDVFVEQPESRAAQREALTVLVEELLASYPAHYAALEKPPGQRVLRVEATGEALDLSEGDLAPLEVVARAVQEDLCVMEARPSGWCLTAGAVCFPTRWRLRPMLGLPMTAIHDRVPGYREQLDHSANRFFDGIKGGAVFRRGNWSLMDDPTLFQPTGKEQLGQRDGLDASSAGENVWLRVERQTLQRLQGTGAILFTIRVHRSRLDDVACNLEAAESLLGAIETMAPAMQRYKSLSLVRDAAVAYLADRIRERDRP